MKKAFYISVLVILSIIFIGLFITGTILFVNNQALAWTLTLALGIDFCIIFPLWVCVDNRV